MLAKIGSLRDGHVIHHVMPPNLCRGPIINNVLEATPVFPRPGKITVLHRFFAHSLPQIILAEQKPLYVDRPSSCRRTNAKKDAACNMFGLTILKVGCWAPESCLCKYKLIIRHV
jgi:hypothetical protein